MVRGGKSILPISHVNKNTQATGRGLSGNGHDRVLIPLSSLYIHEIQLHQMTRGEGRGGMLKCVVVQRAAVSRPPELGNFGGCGRIRKLHIARACARATEGHITTRPCDHLAGKKMV